jgi:transposase-like protein
MLYILPKILTLCQYKYEMDHNSEHNRPSKCAYCGKALPRRHAKYERKAERGSASAGGSRSMIFIQRYYCGACKRTTSALPECIAPRRWYLWEIQQCALMLSLLGKSANAIAKDLIPSRHTISRWMRRFKERFILHKDTLCVHFSALGRTNGLSELWQACFEKCTLGAAMRLCHVAEVFIP